MVKLKRAYEPATRADGYRVLVDRLWPRGLRKDDLPLDAWEKELAPSAALRTWFGHDPERWTEFRRRYRAELRRAPARARLAALAARAAEGTVTLVFAARDAEHSNAAVLLALLGGRKARKKSAARKTPTPGRAQVIPRTRQSPPSSPAR